MLLGNALMPFLNNYRITICFGQVSEANSAAGDVKILSDFPSYGTSGFLLRYIFCHGMID